MKYGLSLLCLLLCRCALGQPQMHPPVNFPTDSVSGEPRLQEVHQLPKPMKPDDIISATRTWAAKTYRDANKVIQQYDPEPGVAIVKGVFRIQFLSDFKSFGSETPVEMQVRHTITIQAKQGRYRATMDGFTFEIPPSALNTSAVSLAFDSRGCALSGQAYRQYVLEETEKSPYVTKKQMLRSLDKNPEVGMNDLRKKCAAVKKEALITLESLKQHLIKTSKESDW